MSRVCVRVCRVCHVKEGLSSGPAVCGCARGTHRKLYLKVKLVYLCAWHPPAVCFCYICLPAAQCRLCGCGLRGRGRACRVWTSRYGFRLLSSVSACKFSVYKYMDMRVHTPHTSQETAHAELSDASSATCACFPVAIMTARELSRPHPCAAAHRGCHPAAMGGGETPGGSAAASACAACATPLAPRSRVPPTRRAPSCYRRGRWRPPPHRMPRTRAA